MLKGCGTDTLRYWGEHYTPALSHDRIGYDVRNFVNSKTPPAHEVYRRLGMSGENHEVGLDLIPPPPKGGKPRCAWTTLCLLALVSAPRRCLLGYEIIALLMGHYSYFRETTTMSWVVRTCSRSVPLSLTTLTRARGRIKYGTRFIMGVASLPRCQLHMIWMPLNECGISTILIVVDRLHLLLMGPASIRCTTIAERRVPSSPRPLRPLR